MDVQIFETQPESEDDEQVFSRIDHINDEIESKSPSVDEAAQNFVNSVYFKQETITSKVQRIRREILELKQLGAHAESQSLLGELNETLNSKNDKVLNTRNPMPDFASGGTATGTIESHSKLTPNTATAEFLSIEKRVAHLEKVLGASARAPLLTQPLYPRLKSLSESLLLLSTDKESLSDKVDVISNASITPGPDDEVNWLYSRLKKYDMAIEALPSLVSRLQTLNDLHSSWAQTDQRINDLTTQLELVRNEIEAWKKSLAVTESAVDRYIEISNKNVSNESTNI